MKEFSAIFGIKEPQIKETCILMPLLSKGILDIFRIRDFAHGKLYSSGNSDNFTLIRTGVAPALIGDALLYLKETTCKNVILFGSCGLLVKKQGLFIGSIVTPSQSYAYESFSDLLLNKDTAAKVFFADKDLLNNFLSVKRKFAIKKVICATCASLKLEADLLPLFKKKEIKIVDMESSAFFSAASFAGLRAIALFYITDIIKKQPFYIDLEPDLKLKLSLAIKSSTSLLCNFAKRKALKLKKH